MAHQQEAYNLDSATQLKDAGLVAASAAGTVDSAAAYVDFGSSGQYHKFDIVVDWSACEIGHANEIYTLVVEVANETAFDTTMERKERLALGANDVTGNIVDTPAAGRAIIHSDNIMHLAAQQTGGRYVRIYCIVAGTIATGFNYTAYLVPTK